MGKHTKVEAVTRILRMTVYSRAPLKYRVASWENSCILSASVKQETNLTCSLSSYTNY